MNIKQLQEQRAAALTEAQNIMSAETITSENRERFDAVMADVNRIAGDIERLSSFEEQRRALQEPTNQPAPKPGESADPEERAEVRAAAQRASLRKWMATGTVETRDLTVAGTGVIVPTAFDSNIREAQKSYGDIYNLVNVEKTPNGDPMKVVLDDDTSNGLYPIGSGAAEVDPTLTGEQLQVSEFTTGAIGVENALLQDAGFDLEKFIRDKFGKRFFRGASGLIIAGDGGNVQSLTATYNTALTVQTETAGVIDYDDVVKVMYALDTAYMADSYWAVNQNTLGQIMEIKDTAGRPIFLPAFGAADEGFSGTILGRKVRLVTQLPNVATGNVPLLFGSFGQAYTFRQVNPGLVILRNPYSLMNQNKTAFYGFARLGGICTVPNSAVSPLVSLNVK